MRRSILVLFSIIVPVICSAQRTDETVYYAWIKKLDRSITSKGYIVELGEDFVIHIDKSTYSWEEPNFQNSRSSIPVSMISHISTRKSGNVGKGLAMGSLIGGGVLGLVALAGNNSGCSQGSICIRFDDGTAFLMGFVVGAIPGGLIGIVAGSKTTKYYIHGDKTSYQKQKEKLKKLLRSNN